MVDQIRAQLVECGLRIGVGEQAGPFEQGIEGFCGITGLDHPVGVQQDLVAVLEADPVRFGWDAGKRREAEWRGFHIRAGEGDVAVAAHDQGCRVAEVQQGDLVLVDLGEDGGDEFLPTQVPGEA